MGKCPSKCVVCFHADVCLKAGWATRVPEMFSARRSGPDWNIVLNGIFFFFSLCESKIPNTYFNLFLPEDPDIYMYHSHISSSDINPLYYVRIFQNILYYLWGINSSPSHFAWVLLHYRGDRLANVNPAALVTKPIFAARIKNVIISVTTTTWQSLVDINTAAPSIRVAYYLWIAAAPPLCLYFPSQLKKKKYLTPLAWRSNLHPSGVCSPVSSGKDSHHQTERCWFIQAASKRLWCVHKPHSATPSAQRCNEAHPRCPSCPHVPAARRYFIQESHKQERRQGGNSVPLGRCESLHHCCGQSLLLSDNSAQAHIDIQEDFQNFNFVFLFFWMMLPSFLGVCEIAEQ